MPGATLHKASAALERLGRLVADAGGVGGAVADPTVFQEEQLMSEQHQTSVGGVRVVALSRVSPGEDFNPRTGRDPDRFAQLVASVKADGVLQPLLVTPDGDDFRIIAGEGRWLAAGEAALTEVPVHVVTVDERTGGLELAMAENLARQDLDPVQEAHGYDRLRTAGLTKKGIAELVSLQKLTVA